MEISEIKNLKSELENIIPNDILEKSKDVYNHFSSSIEDYKRIESIVSGICEKVSKIKKALESDIEELLIKRTEDIAESMKLHNDRVDVIKGLEKSKIGKEHEIGNLELTSLGINEKINATQKNLDMLVFEKNTIAQEITDFASHLQRMKTQEQEINNTTKNLEDKKNIASRALSEIQDLISEEKSKLQMVSNEIIIANERMATLK